MRLYVGNLSKEVTRIQLRELATPYGRLVTLRVAVNPANSEARGFAFLEYSNADEGRAAITGLNGLNVNGQEIVVNEAEPMQHIPSPAER